jgi:FkbM family methyltransferase
MIRGCVTFVVLPAVECILCENSFGRYAVPRSSQHRPSAQMVLSGGVWERATLDYMRAHVRGQDIAHAGMYFGDFLPALAAVLGRGGWLRRAGWLYGFEPNRENFACAQWTCVLNGLRNVRLSSLGLGETRQQVPLQIADEQGLPQGGASRIVTRKQAGNGAYMVEIAPLDELLPAEADIGILHLDVEGYEAPALMGGLKTIRRCKPILILETVPPEVVEAHLAPLGYRRVATVDNNTIFRIKHS